MEPLLGPVVVLLGLEGLIQLCTEEAPWIQAEEILVIVCLQNGTWENKANNPNIRTCNIFASKCLDNDIPAGPPVAIATELLGPLLP